jgi:hypothetical protein
MAPGDGQLIGRALEVSVAAADPPAPHRLQLSVFGTLPSLDTLAVYVGPYPCNLLVHQSGIGTVGSEGRGALQQHGPAKGGGGRAPPAQALAAHGP